MNKPSVPAFAVDPSTIPAGIMLRDVKRVGLFSKVKIWDIRFKAPSSKEYLIPQVSHTIVHIFSAHLKHALDSSFITFNASSCSTGFELVTTSDVNVAMLTALVKHIISETVPIISKEEIPFLNEKECPRPNYFAIKETTNALAEFGQIL